MCANILYQLFFIPHDLYVQSEQPNPSAKEAPVPFEHKMLAFRALKQGLKYKYESWRMWSNYMVIAMDVGELSEACRALSRVVEERAEKDGERSVDIEVLERLVGAVTRGTEPEGDSAAQTSNGAVSYGLERQVTDLFIRIILPRISSSPRIFHAYARLLTYQQQWGPALQAHLNAYRTSVSDDKRVETDLARWQGAVTEVEELVDVMRNLGLRVVDEGEKRKTSWDFQARSILRTFMGRTKAAFGDEPEWERLTATLDDLRRP